MRTIKFDKLGIELKIYQFSTVIDWRIFKKLYEIEEILNN